MAKKKEKHVKNCFLLKMQISTAKIPMPKTSFAFASISFNYLLLAFEKKMREVSLCD